MWGTLLGVVVLYWDREKERSWGEKLAEISSPNPLWHERWEVMPEGTVRDRREPESRPSGHEVSSSEGCP